MLSIDTLYIYSKSTIQTPDIYHFLCNYLLENKAKFLGVSRGREWYYLNSYRIGIMDGNKATLANQPHYEIQYDWSELKKMNSINDLSVLPLPFGSLYDWKVKRIDYNETYIDSSEIPKNWISPFRKQAILKNGSKIETVYLGNRSTGKVFRIYDKSVEMQAKQDYQKLDYYGNIFGTIDNIKSFEIEYHRKRIIETLEDYEDNLTESQMIKLYSLFVSDLGKIKYFDDDDIKNYENNNYSRMKLYDLHITITECYEDVKRKKVSSSVPSEEHLIKRMKKTMLNYIEYIDKIGGNTDVAILSIANKLFYGVGYGKFDIVLEDTATELFEEFNGNEVLVTQEDWLTFGKYHCEIDKKLSKYLVL